MSEPASLPTGSIRQAEPRDRAELEHLFAAAHVAVPPLDAARRQRSHLLVLDAGGAIRAAVHVVIDSLQDAHARLQVLVVDPSVAAFRRVIEDRMVGVATALCEAFGCRDVAIAATA